MLNAGKTAESGTSSAAERSRRSNPLSRGGLSPRCSTSITTSRALRRIAMAADDDLTTKHPVVSHDEWLAARRELLEKEKAFTRQCDEISRLQRSLPWERVTKEYVFVGRDGPESFATL